MSISIRLTVDGNVLEGTLYSTVSSAQLIRRLPLELELTRWGNAYLGSLHRPLGPWLESEARTLLQIGELAWWPERNALCIFFGSTPASEADEPRAASPVNPLGILSSGLSALAGCGPTVRASFEAADTHVRLRV